MEITVHGKHSPVPESLKQFAAEKAGHLEKYLSTITSVDVQLYEDGKPHKTTGTHVANLTVTTPGPVFRSKVTSVDPRAGLDDAIERIERQIKEFKRKRSGKPAHAKPKAPLIPAPETSEEEAG